MWVWHQKVGKMYDKNGSCVGCGYSGLDAGKNNPAMQADHGTGPIPQGTYKMTGLEQNGPTGPNTVILVPDKDTNTFGRSEFRIHGDSVSHPGQASHGCIILPLLVRLRIWGSHDHDLQVVA